MTPIGITCLTFMLIIKDKLLYMPFTTVRCWPVNSHRRNINWSSHGLKFTKRTYLLIGNWLSMAKNLSKFEDLTNENCRNYSKRKLHSIYQGR